MLFSVQPSEFMKLAMIAFLAKFLSERQKLITSFKKRDASILGFSVFGIWFDHVTARPWNGNCNGWNVHCHDFYFGARISHFVGLGLIGVAGFIGLILSAPYRIKRITSFLDPWEDPLGSGFQMIQSFYAIGPGVVRIGTRAKPPKVFLFTRTAD